MATEKKVEVFTWKVVPVGDGSLYGFAKFDKNGDRVEIDHVEEGIADQVFPSAADAEKHLRTFVTTPDVIEVAAINNVNTLSNKDKVVLVVKSEVEDRYHGMEPVKEAIDEPTEEEKAKIEADQRKAQEKADARKEKEEKSK